MMQGSVAGRLLLLESTRLGGRLMWLCECNCSRQKWIRADGISSGAVLSCGCLSADLSRARTLRHGGVGTTAYSSWHAMVSRCHRPDHDSFPYYGGRGIVVCDRWRLSFEAFREDMGEPAKGMQIDRINTNGNYEPGNCRWATAKENANNRRNNIVIELNGIAATPEEWSQRTGIPTATIRTRHFRGWSAERILSPRDHRKIHHGKRQ